MENHTNQTYQKRMNKTALSKFGAIEKHLEKGMKLLDFGSGFSPEFIKQVQQTGAHYVAYDVSNIVQNQLKENNIDFLTKEQLANTEDEFDVIYLSSVFHELMSYLSRPERRETFAMLDKALKPDLVKTLVSEEFFENRAYTFNEMFKDLGSENEHNKNFGLISLLRLVAQDKQGRKNHDAFALLLPDFNIEDIFDELDQYKPFVSVENKNLVYSLNKL